MAINLSAVFRVRNLGSAQLSRINRNLQQTTQATQQVTRATNTFRDANGRLRNMLGQYTAQTNQASNASRRFSTSVNRLQGSSHSATSSLSGLTAGLLGAVGAYASLQTAKSAFEATVGQAMVFQQSQAVISAMFDDKALSSQYMKIMDRIAIDSPLLDSQAMYANSKSFITGSKDLGQLEQMWSLAERLVALDPSQGVEGAVYALRELFSGDAISIVDRFEMDRTVMNNIKKLPLEKQLGELDKYFNKIGATTELIDEMGDTALGMWTQVKERFALVLRSMGEPSLKAVSKFLGDVISRLEGAPMKKFAEWGSRAIESVVSGLSSSAVKIYDYFTQLASDPVFKSKSTLTGKINFVIEDIADKFQAWYDGGGRDKVVKFGSDVAQILVAAMDATDEIFVLGAKLGASVWGGVIKGVKKSALESPIGKLLNTAYNFTPQSVTKNSKEKLTDYWSEKGWLGFGDDSPPTQSTVGTPKSVPSYQMPMQSTSGFVPGYYHGLENVEYDGKIARLHKNERVLTAQENKEYSQGGGSSAPVINIAKMEVRKESDIEDIAFKLAKLIEKEAMQRGHSFA